MIIIKHNVIDYVAQEKTSTFSPPLSVLFTDEVFIPFTQFPPQIFTCTHTCV